MLICADAAGLAVREDGMPTASSASSLLG